MKRFLKFFHSGFLLASTLLLMVFVNDAQAQIGSKSSKGSGIEATTSQNVSIAKTDGGFEDLTELLQRTRNSLSDFFEGRSPEYPDVFLIPAPAEERVEQAIDPRAGFRVQLISTRKIALADSLQLEYTSWSDSVFTAYRPYAYLVFKQPYYKVHVGDFRDRETATLLARSLKRKYTEAWVVFDRIEPARVPSAGVNVLPSREDDVQNRMQGAPEPIEGGFRR